MNERRIRALFRLSILLKGAHALLECAAGLLLAFAGTSAMSRLVERLTQDELLEDPNDFLARHLLELAGGLSGSTQRFYAFYLLSHGVVKLLLVLALLRNRLWAYPASLVVFGLFIVYQLYRFSYTHSPGLVALSVLDLVVIVLIWHEYRVMRS